MKKLILLSLLPFTTAAQNLVPNGDFNRVNVCEAGAPCAPKAWYTSYDIDWAYQRFRQAGVDGSLCLIFSEAEKAHTYWQSELVVPLQAGEKYRLQYSVRAMDGATTPGVIQFSLARGRTHLLGMARLKAVTPAVLKIKKRKRADGQWVKVMAEYTAAGGEAWLVVGNFTEEAPASRTFYLVDNLSLEPVKRMRVPDYGARVSALYRNRLRHEWGTKGPGVKEPVAPENGMGTAPALALQADTLRLPDILFATDSDVLEDTVALAGVWGKIKAGGYSRVLVQGHTDNSGTGEHNMGLSTRRAGAVAVYLVRNGIPESSLTVTGMGSQYPLRPNDTPENRRANRRVELVILHE